MRLLPTLPRRIALAAIAVSSIALVAIAGGPLSIQSGAASTPSQNVVASTGLITAGPSRSECLTPALVDNKYGLSYLQSLITSFDSVTDSSVSCISSYLNGAPNWSAWDHPWIESPMYGYSSWVMESPQTRELVLEVNLIPNNLENVNNPSKWEKSCAAGKFDGYAKTLGESLVSAGLQNSVIRLGAEMNGVWEADFIGTTKHEQNMWAKCFANEVTGMRQATGEHLLFDWNPNACKGDYAYSNYYPGNAYVDIVGLDLYDVGCETPYTPLSFSQLASEPAGLNKIEAFAKQKGKPMSLPEWGLSTIPSGDDPGYINGIGSAVANGDYAFETYFDASGYNVKALPLGPKTPLSLTAFRQWFGDAAKS
jgi:hypothetical protein